MPPIQRLRGGLRGPLFEIRLFNLGECPVSARLGRCPEPRRTSPERTHSGHSTEAARTGVHAPYLPFAIPAGSGSIGWTAVVRVPDI